MADATVRGLLINCQLGHLIEKFSEKGVGIDILEILDDSELATLVPVWGQRIKFKKAVDSYLSKISTILNNDESNIESISTVSAVSSRFTEATTSTTDSSSSQTFILQEDGSLLEIQNNNQPDNNSDNIQIDDDISNIKSDQENRKRPLDKIVSIDDTREIDNICSLETQSDNISSLETESGSRKRLRKSEAKANPTESNSISDFDLKSLLQNSCMGKAILAVYETQHILDSRCQSYLCDIIVTHFLNGNYPRLMNKDHYEIAKSIQKLFPNEKAGVYYTAPIKKQANKRTNKSISSKGKLVDKYRNKVTFLRKAKVVPNLRFSFNDSDEDLDVYNAPGTSAEPLNNEDLLWLKSHVEPWNTVQEKWGATYQHRYESFQKEISLTQIYNEWPILKQNLSYCLIDDDFSRLHPTSTNLLFSKWEDIYNKLLNLKKTSVTNATDSLLLNIITSNSLNTATDYRHYLMLTILPSLIPSTSRLSKGKKQQWKLTSADVKDSIIISTQLPGDIISRIEEREEKCRKQGMTRQPFIIVDIEDVNIKNVYVSVTHPNGLYKVPSLLKAVDICFKAFHVFNLKYPIESEHLWVFIQTAIYGIETRYDPKIPSIIDIVNKISL